MLAQNTKTSQQVTVDYNNPQTYTLGGIRVTGLKSYMPETILPFTGFEIGDKIRIPSDEVSSMVKRIWMQRAFSNVALLIDSVVRDTVYLNLEITEHPKSLKWEYNGVR